MIIPVIKNKSGHATDKHNYRPIAISTTMSKVLELLMLHKIDSYLFTTDNQFGFKQNHGTVSYADDMAILSPSATALQKLLDICSVYSEKHDIVYNVKKSVCMVINSAKYKITNLPRVYLAGVFLEYVERYKYKGMIIHVRNDDYDITIDNSDL